MALDKNSPAVKVARAHVEAWSNHDWQAAQDALAEDVKVQVTTTGPFPPPVNTVGVDDYMAGLHAFADAVIPASMSELAAIGDERNALVLVMVDADFGMGPTTLPGARVYLLDDHGKIAHEQVVFFAGS
ncbi:MAG TPA: nuclear transport factor 2 family protein [Acidimicrobiales bacterium]|nr:nuclear transport factor 2 family protein [Acidimicrobiales bacterium]